jgi:diadenosine tetraphosphate (Ap4A) HIT family hydrolase
MNLSEQACAFCDNLNTEGRAIFRDDVVIAFPTNTPIVPGHILICPVRHVEKIDDLRENELTEMMALLIRLKKNTSRNTRGRRIQCGVE